MSKTQLQTNNAKLEALITELQSKAAGGGGGGFNMVTGRYRPTSKDYMNYPITITGLGFKPKFVYFYYRSNITTDLATPYLLKSAMWKEGDDSTTYTNVSLMGGKTYVPTVEKSGITVTEDGFTLKSPRSDYALFDIEGDTYGYVAIG